MRKFWSSLGKAAFWVSLPVLWIYLRSSRRTRVIIVCDDEFLVVRGWLSSGDWSLPGGGLHKGENSLQALIREVQEETGIALFEKDVKFLFTAKRNTTRYGFVYDCFEVALQIKPVITLQKYEIAEYMWVPLSSSNIRLSKDTSYALAQWRKLL